MRRSPALRPGICCEFAILLEQDLFARGLQFGGSMYRDQTPTATTNIPYSEWIASGHLAYTPGAPEFIAEFANITHETVAGRPATSNSQAWYIQAAYRLTGIAALWKPYYRFEYIHIPRSDPIFVGVPSLAGSVVGVREISQASRR